MDYTIKDGTVGDQAVKVVGIGGAQLNLMVEVLESKAFANGPQTDLSIAARVVRLDDAGNRLDEGPVTMQTISGEGDLRLQAEVDNLVQRAIGQYLRGIAMRQAAVSLAGNLVGAAVNLAPIDTVARPAPKLAGRK